MAQSSHQAARPQRHNDRNWPPAAVFLDFADPASTFKNTAYEADSSQPVFALRAQNISRMLLRGGRLLYTPIGNPEVEAVMDKLRAAAVPAARARIVGCASPGALAAEYSASNSSHPVWAGVVFANANRTALPDALQVHLRMNGSDVPDPTENIDDTLWRTSLQSDFYYFSGFALLQQSLAQAWLELRNAPELFVLPSSPTLQAAHFEPQQATKRVFSLNATEFQSYPLRAYSVNNFRTTMEYIGSLYFVIGFNAVVVRLVQYIVLEKERKTKEGMKMAGLRSVVLQLSWYLTYCMITLIPIGIIALLSAVAHFFDYTAGWALLVLLLLYVQTLLQYAFLMSNFFDKSQSAGQMSSLTMLILFLPSYGITSTTSAVGIGFACLSSPIAFSQGFNALTSADNALHGISASNMTGGPDTVFPFWASLMMLAIDSVLYFILGWYFEQVLPKDFGVTRSPLFCCRRDYWMANNKAQAKSTKHEVVAKAEIEMQSAGDSPSIEPVPNQLQGHEFIRIEHLRKVFDAPLSLKRDPKKQQGVVAVDDFSLELYSNQITALLGHNGAGKSTVVSILSGLFEPTGGRVTVDGKDLQENMDIIRKSLGVCPQQDVLFDHLTVGEHLRLFAKLKEIPDEQIEAAITEKVREVGLEEKINELALTLSGGQKRKLMLAIALLGESKLLILDEPTSGMDPQSRRLVWALLQKYKVGRVLILCTHYMDEADLLADRVAIMSKGRLRCVGSSLFLKSHFGSVGYHLDLTVTDQANQPQLHELVGRCVQGAYSSAGLVQNANEMHFVLPIAQIGSFEQLFQTLEEHGASMGVQGFGVSLTSLEEVFLNLANESQKHEQHSPVSDNPSGGDKGDKKIEVTMKSEPDTAFAATKPTDWRPNPLQQLRALIWKRFTMTRRNPRGLIFALIVPALYICILLSILASVRSPPLGFVTPPSLSTQVAAASYTGPPVFLAANSASMTSLNNLVSTSFAAQGFTTHSTAAQNITALQKVLLSETTPDSFFSLLATSTGVRVLSNSSAVHGIPVMIDALTNAHFAAAGGQVSFTTTIDPFPYQASTKHVDATDVTTGILVGLAFCYIPATFAFALTQERQSGAKRLMMIMGTSPAMFWLSNIIFDVCCFLVTIILTFILFAAFSENIILGTHFGPALLLFILYAFSACSMTYALTWLFTNAVSTPTITIGYIMLNLIFFFVELTIEGTTTGNNLMYFFNLLPPFSLSWGLFNLGVQNLIDTQASGSPGYSPVTASTLLGYGEYCVGSQLLTMFLVGCFCLTINWLIEIGWLKRAIDFEQCRKAPAHIEHDATQTAEPDEEAVAAEVARVEAGLKQGKRDIISCEHLRKEFHLFSGFGDTRTLKVKVAVSNLTLGIGEGCFGLLGPNGAGKSTSLNLLVGDIDPTNGDAFLGGHSITKEPVQAHEQLGICPQTDSLSTMFTGREHLLFFCGIKGIPPARARELVEQYITFLRLEPFANKYAENYSGGNKRKLSLAIAMIAGPRIGMYDEPSTGLDPQARRRMWDLIRAETPGRSFILTTHSMEEADSLCTRIGIMINGRLKCLGSSQQLKSKYGSGYQVELKLARDDQKSTAAAREFLISLLHVGSAPSPAAADGPVFHDHAETEHPTASAAPQDEAGVGTSATAGVQVLEDFGGRLRVALPKRTDSGHPVLLSRLFGEIQRARERLGIIDYSVSQTTLEQVFLSFARHQVQRHDA